jgi:phosphatidate cytidylyltransferase
VDERDEYESEAWEAAEPVAERVRITGAQSVGEVTVPGEPAWSTAPPIDPERLGDPGAVTDDTEQTSVVSAGDAELPHWTEPATGQVPAVLDRRGDDEQPWSAADTGPAWREHHHEWEEASFEPALLADDETRVGALDDAAPPERLQWEFDELTEAVPVAGALGEKASRPSAIDSSDDPEKQVATGLSISQIRDPESAGPTDPGDVDRADVPATAEPPMGWDPASGGVHVASRDETPNADTGQAGAPAGAAHDAVRDDPVLGATAGMVGRSRGRDPDDGVGAPRPRVQRNGEPPGGSRNVPVAVATGVAVAVVALACFALGTVATVSLATVVVVLAAAECFAALRRGGYRPATLLGLVASGGLVVVAYSKGVAAFPFVIALAVAAAMIWYLVGAERGSPIRGIGATLLGFAWVGVFGGFAGLMLAPSQYPHRHGIAFLLGAVIAVVGADVGALVTGSWLGRHPLAPRVSPNKTWEGFAGGVVLAVVLSVVITGHISPWTPGKAAVLGVVIALVGPVGDLCESLIKRDLGLKDMGSLLPGHGGILDRVDALLFAMPATYYLVRVLHLG